MIVVLFGKPGLIKILQEQLRVMYLHVILVGSKTLNSLTQFITVKKHSPKYVLQ